MLVHLITDYLSIIVGLKLYLTLNKNKEIVLDREKKVLYFLGALFGAFVGSRVLAFLENPFQSLNNVQDFIIFFSNKTIIGGIAGGIIGIEVAKKVLKIKNRTGDNVVMPLVVAIIIGRIGCQYLGVADGTIGTVCNYLWCFNQGDGLLRHPIPTYEILELLTFLGIYFFYLKYKKFKDGFIFRIFIIIYFSFRFMFEFIKDTNSMVLGLSAIQLVCASFVLLYVYDIIRHRLYESK